MTIAITVMTMQVLFSAGTVLLIMVVARECFDCRTADVQAINAAR